MTAPFLREAAVYAWPSSGTFFGIPTSGAVELFSDGTLDTLAMRFSVRRSIVSVATDSQIILYNLKRETRDFLRTPGLNIALEVGWSNTTRHTLFIGSLLQAVTRRSGPDLLTTLMCLTGADALAGSVISYPYPAGMAVTDVLKDLVGRLPGVTLDAARLRIDPSPDKIEAIGTGGRCFTGTVKDALDSLANEFGFSWSIQNNTFQALHDPGAFPRLFEVSAANGGLISAVPLLKTIMQLKMGVEIKALLSPDLLPGDQVSLKSILSPGLNGVYVIQEAEYQGSPNEHEWTMLLRCYDFSMVMQP
jgi:hypothetical protein